MRPKLSVRDYMTCAPHSIGLDQSLASAAQRMRHLGVRHLPVLEGGSLRGVISERDVALVESLAEMDPRELSVEEAMTAEPYTVSERAPLRRVAKAMSEHKYGCAVVMDGPAVIGIFTTTDALRALSDVLEQVGETDESMTPSQVRLVILAEHVHLRNLLESTERAAERILSGGGFGDVEVKQVREQAQHLRTAFVAHMELENRVLAPALRDLDSFGPVRAERLIAEHEEQKKLIDGVLMSLDDRSQPSAALAAAVERLISILRKDMEIEEGALLNSEILRDDGIALDAETG